MRNQNPQALADLSSTDKPDLQSLQDEFEEIRLDTFAFSGLLKMLDTAISEGCSNAKTYEDAVWYISGQMHDHAHRVDLAVDQLCKAMYSIRDGGANHAE